MMRHDIKMKPYYQSKYTIHFYFMPLNNQELPIKNPLIFLVKYPFDTERKNRQIRCAPFVL